MSKLFNHSIGLLLLALLLSSCKREDAMPTVSPTVQMYTATTLSVPVVVETAVFTTTPLPLTPAPTAQLTLTPERNEHIYTDPEGWYTFDIPAGWQPADEPNTFEGEDGFFQTGYLPEMMFMRQAMNVCHWLANVDTKNEYAVSWLKTIDGNGCQVESLPPITPAVIIEVVENPSADFQHRFFYIKANEEQFNRITNTFVWLKPVDMEAEVDFHTAPLRAEDISFWENRPPLPSAFSVTEYKLPAEAQGESPGETILLDFVPREILQEAGKLSRSTYTDTPRTLESVNETIAPFGYEFRAGDERYPYYLYKNEALLLEHVYRLPELHLFSTDEGTQLVFLATALDDPDQPFYVEGNATRYLIENNTVTLWENKPAGPMLEDRVIWVDGAPLLLGMGDHIDVQVRNGRYDLLFSFATYYGASIPLKRFRAWNDHWILAVSNFIIQDGEILNEKYGFEETFDWYVVNDKPFYFFRKGPRVGISYDDQFRSLHYDEIIHGYCCGLALNNPRLIGNTISFFGKRDGVWHYVILKNEVE